MGGGLVRWFDSTHAQSYENIQQTHKNTTKTHKQKTKTHLQNQPRIHNTIHHKGNNILLRRIQNTTNSTTNRIPTTPAQLPHKTQPKQHEQKRRHIQKMATRKTKHKINTDQARKQRQIRQLQNKTYGRKRCKWCNKTFTRKHTRQQYCSKTCAYQSQLEHDRIWHRTHKQRKRLGTGRITGTHNKDHNIEKQIIQKEKKRLGL